VKLIRRPVNVRFALSDGDGDGDYDGAADAPRVPEAAATPRPTMRRLAAVTPLLHSSTGPARRVLASGKPAAKAAPPASPAVAIPTTISQADAKLTLETGMLALKWGTTRWPAVAVKPSQLFMVRRRRCLQLVCVHGTCCARPLLPPILQLGFSTEVLKTAVAVARAATAAAGAAGTSHLLWCLGTTTPLVAAKPANVELLSAAKVAK